MGRGYYFIEFVLTWLAVVLWIPLMLVLMGISVSWCDKSAQDRIFLAIAVFGFSIFMTRMALRAGLSFGAYVQRREREWNECTDPRGRLGLRGAPHWLLTWNLGIAGPLIAAVLIMLVSYVGPNVWLQAPSWLPLLFRPCGFG